MLQGSNLPLVDDLRRQMRTELRLAAWTLQKDHQPTRHLQCDVAAAERLRRWN
jgi:hypothetical protein